MANRNLLSREDIDDDVLRQRRDLYAVSIGLVLFHLAGGSVGDQASLTGILPLKFANPCVFLWAAWVGFVYFFLRYRLLAPPAFSRYWQEAMWQAGNLPISRRIAAEQISRPKDPRDEAAQKQKMLKKAGPVPMLVFGNFHFRPKIKGIKERGNIAHVTTFSQERGETPLAHTAKAKLWLAAIYGLIVSTWRERSFTDYVLPYLVAVCAVVAALFDFAVGDAHICTPW